MARTITPPPDIAYEAIRRSHMAGRIVIFTDANVLNRPGSPVYSTVDVFAPPLILMASSLTLLFAFGLVQWIVALVLIMLWQAYGARYFVEWRLHRRTVEATVRNMHNMRMLWEMGGIAIALKDWPEKNCVSPYGDWRSFAGDFLIDPEPVMDQPEG